ncbi:GPP34 family phosphoprotein [Streptomyces sp. TRM 70351]|uniref:GOLPH3/VPS74 family protein n=1 Tax=Streptomyces sp. TRM 70351 TaxID=3116552 RepID=UPI002E7C24AC|nr:GPP34 family phosphoprotein [Streptomyces sp. TRM 70351]MEE1930335.1 GPP34 family phosphoprotein [Streptomyces sp. TRM 70351]
MGTALDTTLGEQLMLLNLDDETGTARQAHRVPYATAGAALLELAMSGRVTIGGRATAGGDGTGAPPGTESPDGSDGSDGGRVVVRDATPLGVQSLDAALIRIHGSGRPRGARHWIGALARESAEAARAGLLAHGLVREEHRRVLGVFPGSSRYPETDGSVERKLRLKLTAVVHDGVEPDERTAALLALVHGAGLHRTAFPGADEEHTGRRLDELTRGHWATPAVRAVIGEVQSALCMAVLTPVLVTTAS